MTLTQPQQAKNHNGNAVWIVLVVAGITAALHIWKLPAALPIIQESLGFSLVTAGVLLGIVQLAGVAGGLAVSLLAEILGPRRTMIIGLSFLSAGSAIGALSMGAGLLLTSRAIEGIGFIMATVVGPGLVRSHAPAPRINLAIACWSAYQGAAILVGLIVSAFLLQVTRWQSLWWAMVWITLGSIVLVLRFVPADHASAAGKIGFAMQRIGITARHPRIWIAGAIVGCYTIQWMAVIGFLPTIYAQNGLHGIGPGMATGLVGGLNAVGAIVTGTILQRGAPARMLLILAFCIMAATSALTFAVNWQPTPSDMIWQVSLVGLFSLFGAIIPATMTIMAVDLAPPGGSAPAAMGLMQQIFNTGHFLGPVLLAMLATNTGGWSSTWWMTCTFSIVGTALSVILLRHRNRFSFTRS